jgi:hypothetical protein
VKKPDALEKGLRFGCGASLGLLLTLMVWLRWRDYSGTVFFTLLAGYVVICGWLATRYGDRFWERAKNWLWLWP